MNDLPSAGLMLAPHEPFVAPKHYFGLYPDGIELHDHSADDAEYRNLSGNLE